MLSIRPLDVVLSQFDSALLQGSRALRDWGPSEIMLSKEGAYSASTEAARYAVLANSDTYPHWTDALPTHGARSLRVAIAAGCNTYSTPFAVDLFTGVRPFGGSPTFWPAGSSPEVGQLVRIVPVAGGYRSHDPGAITIFETDPSTGDEKQQLLMKGGPTGGTFTLTFGLNTTAGIAYNATAADIQAALEAALGVGQFLVTGGPINTQAVAVQFSGSNGGTATKLLLVDNDGLTGGSSPDVIVGRLPRQEVLGDWWRLRIRAAGTILVTISAQARS